MLQPFIFLCIAILHSTIIIALSKPALVSDLTAPVFCKHQEVKGNDNSNHCCPCAMCPCAFSSLMPILSTNRNVESNILVEDTQQHRQTLAGSCAYHLCPWSFCLTSTLYMIMWCLAAVECKHKIQLETQHGNAIIVWSPPLLWFEHWPHTL